MSFIAKESVEEIRGILLDYMIDQEKSIAFFAKDIGIALNTLKRIIGRKEVSFATVSKVVNYLKRKSEVESGA